MYEFDENGLSINGPNWLQCIAIELTRLTQKPEISHILNLYFPGQVYEFDENGLSINGPNWLQCIAIELNRLTQKHKNKWDRTLQDFAMSPYWSKEQ